MTAPFALVLGGGALLSQVGRELTTVLDRRFADLGVTTQQAALLLHAGRQPTSPSQLTEVLGTDTAGMTRLLDRLETKGLLRRERHAGDRRAVVIELTPAGRALLPRIPPIFGRVNTMLFAGFSAPEVEQLTSAWRRLLDNLRED